MPGGPFKFHHGRSPNAALSLQGSPTTNTSIGATYVFTPDTSGGTPGFTYALTGTLPAGLSFNTSTGVISGTPTTAQTANNLNITVTDAHQPNPNTATLGAFSITVTSSSNLTITAVTPTTATIGLAYAVDPFVTGGTEPYSFSLTGTLPAGLSFDPLFGGIHGTPTTAQNKTGLNINVTDSLGATLALSAPFSILVSDPAWRNVATTTATFWTNLQNAIPGDRLVLAAGSYELDIGSLNKSGVGVQILGQAGVSFTYIQMQNSSGVWFKNFPITGTNGFGIGCYISETARIVCDGLTFTNGAGRGILFAGSGSIGCVAQNNVLDGIAGDGISAVDAVAVLITGNVIKNWQANAIAAYGNQGYIIEKNRIGDYIEPVDPGHPDCLAISNFSARATTGTVRWNRYDRTAAGTAGTNGIPFLEHSDIINVYSNSCFGANTNGCSDSDCTRVGKRNNFSQGFAETGNSKFLTRDGSDHIVQAYNFVNEVTAILGTPTQLAEGYVNPTNYTTTPNTIIAPASGFSDTSARNTFLAANSLIPAAA